MHDNRYTLEHVAQHLRVRQATIRYWLRTFPDLFPDRDEASCAFTECDLNLLKKIREAALDVGYSAQQIRQSLAPQPGWDASVHFEHLERLVLEVQTLREEISFLAEESKELQRLLGLLMQHTMGSKTDVSTLHHTVSQTFAAHKKESRQHPNVAPGEVNGRTDPGVSAQNGLGSRRDAMLPWSPPTLD